MAGLLAPGDRHGDAWHVPVPLQDLAPGSAFELGWRLARTLAHDDAPRARCKQLGPQVVGGTLLVAERLLSGWPDAYRNELAAGTRTEGLEISHRRLLRLRNMVRSTAAWPEVAAIVRSTYPDLIERGRQTLRRLDPAIVTRTEATRLSGVDQATFAKMARSGGLTALSSSGLRRPFEDFDVSHVRVIRDAILGSVPLNTVSELLGCSFHGAEQLAVEAILELEEHTALSAAYCVPRVTRASLAGLLDDLGSASLDPLPEATLPLHIAIKSIQGEKPWSAVARALLDGTLQFRLSPTAPKVFRGMMVEPSCVEQLRTLAFDRTRHPGFAFARDMSRRDVEEALNLSPSRLQAALDQELGRPRSQGRIAVAAVAAMSRRLISAAEISARTHPGTRRLPTRLTRSRLARAGAGGWLRRDVEPLLESI